MSIKQRLTKLIIIQLKVSIKSLYKVLTDWKFVFKAGFR